LPGNSYVLAGGARFFPFRTFQAWAAARKQAKYPNQGRWNNAWIPKPIQGLDLGPIDRELFFAARDLFFLVCVQFTAHHCKFAGSFSLVG
jgi:hypothetical protein